VIDDPLSDEGQAGVAGAVVCMLALGEHDKLRAAACWMGEGCEGEYGAAWWPQLAHVWLPIGKAERWRLRVLPCPPLWAVRSVASLPQHGKAAVVAAHHTVHTPQLVLGCRPLLFLAVVEVVMAITVGDVRVLFHHSWESRAP